MTTANASFGMPTAYKTVTANLGGTSRSLKNDFYLNMPDGTTQTISLGRATNYGAGTNSGTGGGTTINASVWPNATSGSYTVTVNTTDTATNTIVATDSYTFTRTALPATKYVPTFTDATMAANIMMDRMMMDLPPPCGRNADYMAGGSGVAVGDVDGDGYDDIFLIDMMGMGMLYRNNGDGTFTDITASAGIPMVMDQSAAIFADIDNDGHPDLLIMTNPMLDTSPPVLLKNTTDGSGVHFMDISASSGIVVGPSQNLSGATFGDYDNDGLVDLYITVHADCYGNNTNDHLFHNNGNDTFTDVSYLLGGAGNPALSRRGLVTVFFDYNNDGKVDLYVGNDVGGTYGANVLWRNDGPDGLGGWTFTDVSTSTGAGKAISDMGIAIGDFNRDGIFDIFLTNIGHNFLLQLKNGIYNEVEWENQARVARSSVPNYEAPGMTAGITWGTGFYDFNNDGWEDLFEAGGNLHHGTFWSALFQNSQDGVGFIDVSPMTGAIGGMPDMQSMMSMPTAVFSDFNNDGFMDILQFGMMGEPQLFMNNARSNGNPYNWVEVKLNGRCQSPTGCSGTASNKDAIGARIVAMVAGANLSRQVIDGATYQGNSTLVQHFGLGPATQIDSLTVYWPSGKMTVMNNVLANQKITITEPL